jgi:branched-chain amino acid transport system substrate-binding protein
VADVAPHKVGFLGESAAATPESFERGTGAILRARFDEALEAGELDRPVEIVYRSGWGLPSGSADAVTRAWTALADEGVLMILGPGITDNCIAVTPLFEARGIPTINYPGTTKSRGRYGFHYQLGALYGDGPLIVRAMVRRGLATVAVVRDHSPIGAEFFEFFERECDRAGITIVRDVRCSPVADDLLPAAEAAADGQAAALAYLGFGAVLLDLSRALTTIGWTPPRFTTSAGMHFYGKSDDERREMSGWVYVDMVDEDNQTYRAALDTIERRTGARPQSGIAAGMWDIATLAALGIHYAPVLTPEGVTEGLEQIQQVPAALGGAGTVMGFGPWERTALKGEHYLVLREMRDIESVKYTG